MYNPEDRDSKIEEEKLPELVIWPRMDFTPAEIRSIFATVKRFIDFDETIAGRRKYKYLPRSKLRGKPITKFLAEEPYIVQTWNGNGAVRFFTECFPSFPRPVLIILIPIFCFTTPDGENDLGKNFGALSLTGITIIDDFSAQNIHAPDCIILPPDP